MRIDGVSPVAFLAFLDQEFAMTTPMQLGMALFFSSLYCCTSQARTQIISSMTTMAYEGGAWYLRDGVPRSLGSRLGCSDRLELGLRLGFSDGLELGTRLGCSDGLVLGSELGLHVLPDFAFAPRQSSSSLDLERPCFP